ncbi:MAG TPA: hypothetical protein EYP68_03965 [Candidatus Korarchaeota archaeon]|nr:hypothetical protein [Candidatus Korarchaeota archaeon]
MLIYKIKKTYAALLILSLFSIHSFAGACPPSLGTWMSDHYNEIKDKKLTELSIPGSHDAGMYKAHSCTRKKFHGVFVGPTDCNTKTQSLDIAGQLRCGSRYFDFRPVFTKSTAIFDIGHFSKTNDTLGIMGCLGGSLDDILQDIYDFSRLNPQELIIIQFSHYYDKEKDSFGFSHDIENNLTNLVSTKLDSVLVKSSVDLNLLKMNYDSIINHGNVIALFHNVHTHWTKGILGDGELPIFDEYSNTSIYWEMEKNQLKKLDQKVPFLLGKRRLKGCLPLKRRL